MSDTAYQIPQYTEELGEWNHPNCTDKKKEGCKGPANFLELLSFSVLMKPS